MRAKTLLTAILIVSSINVFSQNRMKTKKNVTPQMVVENVRKAAELLKKQGETGLK